MDVRELQEYHRVQQIAKDTMVSLSDYIREGRSESEIAETANRLMKEKGASFWYYGVGSLVFVGKRTTVSISGREYTPTDEVVGRNDLVTVDLAPEINSYWGDFARSFVVADGVVVTGVNGNHSDEVKELVDGVDIERILHQMLQQVATPEMTFEGLYLIMNQAIKGLGYVNLDFKGNLGHSIEKDRDAREYIEKGCSAVLGDGLFTFEPHIKRAGGLYGYKREDIYYFSDGILQTL